VSIVINVENLMLIRDLTKFANDLDAKGLYGEAAVIDEVIYALAGFPAGQQSAGGAPEGPLGSLKWPPAGPAAKKTSTFPPLAQHGPELPPQHGPELPPQHGPDTVEVQREKMMAEYLIKNKIHENFARELAKIMARHPEKEGDEAWLEQQSAKIESKLGHGPYGPGSWADLVEGTIEVM
jgi:hypothetical protein